MSDESLRVAAEAAAAGPWTCAEQTHGEWWGIQSQYFALGTVASKADGDFIAAANPTVVLALLDRVEAAEATLVQLRAIQPDPRCPIHGRNPTLIYCSCLRSALNAAQEVS